MPIYEYQCDNCRKIFDVLQKINADPLEQCIYCQGKVQKIISNTSFQLKGSGWYVTDYAKSKSKANTEKKMSVKKTDTKNVTHK